MVEDPFLKLLVVVCGLLEEAKLSYAITGSVASSFFGEPLTSQDVDICLRMNVAQATRLAGAFPKHFYVSKEAIVQAASKKTVANLVDNDTGLKIDLSVLPDEPFFDSVLARRRPIEFRPDGPTFWTVSPEDIVLMKLLWRKDSRSQKQWDNALSVVRIQAGRLEWDYLTHWARELKLSSDLNALQGQAGI